MTNSSTALQEHGLVSSPKRVLILDYLRTTKAHPTINEIYEDLSKTMPSLSKTTIYNNLKLLEEYKLIRSLALPNCNTQRYDGNNSIHGHFVCQVCAEIFDFDIREEELPKFTSALGLFKVSNINLIYEGLCHLHSS